MKSFVAALQRSVEMLSASVPGSLRADGTAWLGDEQLLAVLGDAAHVIRLAEAVLADAVGELQERSATADRAERTTTRLGCGNVNELVRRSTRASSLRVAEWERTARAVRRRTSISSGELLPAEYPALREALYDGDVGAETVTAISRIFDRAHGADRAGRLAADAELAEAARGAGPSPAVSADDLRLQAEVWAAFLDQDGADPDGTAASLAERRREVRLGRARNGVVSLRGLLLPDVAAQFQLLIDSVLNPHGSGPRFAAGDDDAPSPALVDRRTGPQKAHDALATILTTAATSGRMPSLGGAAPTLTVAVQAEDLAVGRGVAHLDGVDEPVPLAVARQVACCGVVERVALDVFGRIVRIETSDRTFNAYQRKAIVLRDGGCVIPGCRVPATWCEIHHVVPWAQGGPTSTDNGALLCWHHHRTIDTSGWCIRMNHGAPEVRGPSWWDPLGRWRPTTRSPTRLRRHLARRRARPARALSHADEGASSGTARTPGTG